MGKVNKASISNTHKGYEVTNAAELLGAPPWYNTLWDVENGLRALVRELRLSQGLTQKQVAARCGSTQANIASFETGKRYGVELGTKAACALGATREQIGDAIAGRRPSRKLNEEAVAA